jgi:tetratricopeptide (TPR) repeat protein
MRLQGTYTFLSYVTIFLTMVTLLRQREQVDRLVNVALLVSLPISAYGVIQFLHLDPLPWGGDVTARVTSALGNAIFLAAYLIMVVPLTLARLVNSYSSYRSSSVSGVEHINDAVPFLLLRQAGLILAMNLLPIVMVVAGVRAANLWWMALPATAIYVLIAIYMSPTRLPPIYNLIAYTGLLVLQVVAIILTQSRGPWIGLAAGLAAFAVLVALRWRRRTLLRNAMAIAIPLALALVVFNLPIPAFQPLRQIPYLGRLGTLAEIDSGTGKVRWLIWQGSLELLHDRPSPGLEPDQLSWARPWLGYGPDAMSLVVNKVYHPGLGQLEARNASPDRNHLNLLDHLIMTGIIGLSAYLALVVFGLRQGYQALWRAGQPHGQLMMAGLLAALIAHLVESQVGIVIVVTWTYFWVYLAILARADTWNITTDESSASGTASLNPLDKPARLPNAGRGRRSRQAQSRRETARTRQPAAARIGTRYIVAFLSVCGWAALFFILAPPWDDARLAMVVSLLLTLAGIATGALFLLAQDNDARSLQPFRYAAFTWGGAALAVVLFGVAAVMTMDGVSADVLYKRGSGAEQSGQLRSSLQYYQRAIQLQPEQDWYYIFFGRALLTLSEQKPSPVPGSISAGYTVAQLLTLESGQIEGFSKIEALDGARAVFARASQINPLNPDHYANLGRLERHWGQFWDPTRLDRALTAFQQAITISPRTAHLYNELARLYLIKADIPRALEVLQRSLQLDPGFAATYVLLGDLYAAEKRWDVALEAHSRAMQLDPGSLADAETERRINAYIEAGQIEPLASLVCQAVEASPKNPVLRSTYAYVLARQGRPREALAQYQANLSLSPRDWVAYRNIALSYQSLGMITEAITAAQSAIQYAPDAQRKALQDFLAQLQATRKP